MTRRRRFVRLTSFVLVFTAAIAFVTQASDADERNWRINQNWFGVHFPNYRVVRPPGVAFDPAGLLSIPDPIVADIGEHTDFAIGIKQEVLSGQRVLFLKVPTEFKHAGNEIDLKSKSHTVMHQWEVDDQPVVSVHIGQRGTGSILVDESTITRGNFDALLAAFRRGNSARVWLIVDGQPRFSYVISLIGFSAAWDETMGDWRE